MGGRDDETPGVDRAIATATSGARRKRRRAGYPDRIIELVVPSTPGSSADIWAASWPRAWAPSSASASSSEQGRRRGILGTAEVARAKPDGYTLMHGAAFSVTVQPLTERQSSYTAAIVRADLPDLQERPGHRGAAEHLQDLAD
jgi:tripartite-type tricarboxylate transporter receptor subunit TctC